MIFVHVVTVFFGFSHGYDFAVGLLTLSIQMIFHNFVCKKNEVLALNKTEFRKRIDVENFCTWMRHFRAKIESRDRKNISTREKRGIIKMKILMKKNKFDVWYYLSILKQNVMKSTEINQFMNFYETAVSYFKGIMENIANATNQCTTSFLRFILFYFSFIFPELF